MLQKCFAYATWAVGFPFSNDFFKKQQGARIFYIFWYKVQILETRKLKFLYRISLSFRFWHIIHYAFLIKSHDIVSLTLKTSLNFSGNRLCSYL